MTAPLDRIRKAALNPPQLARKAIRNPRLFSEIAEGLKAEKPRVKYGCAKALCILSEQRPDLLYPHFNFFVRLLDHENKIMQWDAAFVLSQFGFARIGAGFETTQCGLAAALGSPGGFGGE